METHIRTVGIFSDSLPFVFSDHSTKTFSVSTTFFLHPVSSPCSIMITHRLRCAPSTSHKFRHHLMFNSISASSSTNVAVRSITTTIQLLSTPKGFSETAAYQSKLRSRDKGLTRPPSSDVSQFHHPKYGWSPDLGDYYSTQRFFNIRKWVYVGSLTVFMVYFCMLREENDVDIELTRPLHTRVPDFEIQHLREKLVVDKARGLDTKQIEARLKVVEQRSERIQKQYREKFGHSATLAQKQDKTA